MWVRLPSSPPLKNMVKKKVTTKRKNKAKQIVKRKNICCVCKKRLTRYVTNKQRRHEEIIWEGHYDTPNGLFCIDCYNPNKINRCPDKE